MSRVPRLRTAGRVLEVVLAALLGVLLVGRAIVEVLTVDPGRPDTYRDDWGGPSYVGVVLVHAGPGLLVVAVLAFLLVRRSRRRNRPAGG